MKYGMFFSLWLLSAAAYGAQRPQAAVLDCFTMLEKTLKISLPFVGGEGLYVVQEAEAPRQGALVSTRHGNYYVEMKSPGGPSLSSNSGDTDFFYRRATVEGEEIKLCVGLPNKSGSAASAVPVSLIERSANRYCGGEAARTPSNLRVANSVQIEEPPGFAGPLKEAMALLRSNYRRTVMQANLVDRGKHPSRAVKNIDREPYLQVLRQCQKISDPLLKEYIDAHIEHIENWSQNEVLIFPRLHHKNGDLAYDSVEAEPSFPERLMKADKALTSTIAPAGSASKAEPKAESKIGQP